MNNDKNIEETVKNSDTKKNCCLDCGTKMIQGGGCSYCYNCGWSLCK